MHNRFPGKRPPPDSAFAVFALAAKIKYAIAMTNPLRGRWTSANDIWSLPIHGGAMTYQTGASGYIGGQVLNELSQNAARYAIRALVRDPLKAVTIEASFPGVRTVIGDLDNSELLIEEANDASIVLHLAANRHLNSVKAIHQGLSGTRTNQPARYWIQVSGASALAVEEISSPSFIPGSASSTQFDDDNGVGDIQALIREHPSRAVDNYMVDTAATTAGINTALVFPPIVYGEGDGPVNQHSIQIPSLVRATLSLGHGVTVGKGQNRWSNIHVRDLGRLFAALVKKAAQGIGAEGLWGPQGLYLTGVGELTFADISAKVAQAAKRGGYIPSDRVEELPSDQWDTRLPHGSVMFGTNARGRANRARRLLDWVPSQGTLEDDIPRAVSVEHSKGGAHL